MSEKYTATFAKTAYSRKPRKDEGNVFNNIHHELEASESEKLELDDLLKRIEQGVPFFNGIYEIDKSLTQAEKTALRELKDTDIDKYISERERILASKKPIFKSTNLALLDVDDVRGSTDPLEVVNTLGAIAYYPSYSDKQTHIKDVPMRRYRLLFRLNEPIDNIKELEYIQEQLKLKAIKEYPSLKSKKIKGMNGKEIPNDIDNIVNGFFFGTNKKAFINDKVTAVNVREHTKRYEEIQAEKELNHKLRELEQELGVDVSESVLNDIANDLGGLNLDTKEWFNVAIGVFYTSQIKGWNDENTARQLQKLDNDEHNLKWYYQYKRPINVADPRTIGSLVRIYEKEGYKLKPSSNKGDTLIDDDTKEVDEVEHIEQYIGSKRFLEILNNEHKTNLIISGTNTGKTRASIEASREYLKENEKTFIYLATPTTAIAEQNAINHDVNTAIFGRMNVKKEIDKAIYKNDRLLIGTYDKAPIIKDNLNGYELIIIMDEAHKEVSDYSYRSRAISKLFELVDTNEVVKFIGLTGTPQELNYKAYEHIKRFELIEEKNLAKKLKFIEFNKIREFDPIVLNQIETNVQKGNKALVLLDNKKKTNLYRDTLKKRGIKASVINADTKRSSSYRYLLEHERFREDIEVILATRAIADGININNESESYVTIIAPLYHGGNGTTEPANFYNIPLIRQTANRLRSKYKEIIIPLFITDRLEEHRKGSKAFDMERKAKELSLYAKQTQVVIEHSYKGNIKNLKHSTIERVNGLLGKNYEEQGQPFNYELAEQELTKYENGLRYDVKLVKQYEEMRESLLEIDKRMIRSTASREKEEYYKYNPYAFKRALERALEVDEIQTSDTKLDEVNTDIAKALRKLREFQNESDKAKRANLREILEPYIYEKIQNRYFERNEINEDEELLVELKKAMNSIQYRTLLEKVTYLDYDEAIKELEYSDKIKHITELEKHFEAIQDIESFENNNNITARMYHTIKENLEGLADPIKAGDRDELLDDLAVNFKLTNNANYMNKAKRKKQFKKVFKKFFIKVEEQRVESARFARYEHVNFKSIATERDVKSENIVKRYMNYIY